MFFLVEKIIFLAVAGGAFLKQIKTRAGKVFPALVLAINFYYLGRGFYFSFATYQLWRQNKFSRFLLPPYNGFHYFLQYSFYHFFKNYLFSLLYFLILFVLMVVSNKLVHGRLFRKYEIWIAGLGLFLCPWPVNLFWLLAVAVLAVTFYLLCRLSCFASLCKKEGRLISLYYLWIPVAILSLLFSKWILLLPIIKDLVV